MNIAIIKYNAGNTKSVEHALHRLGIQPIITDDIEQIQNADKVIFPGVGHAETTMQHLKDKKLDILIKNLKQPVLGICLGQQLMCSHSEEGNVDCLNIFPVQVKKFQSTDNQFKIPQIGWNNLYNLKSPLFNNIDENSFVYFVHSYYCEQSEFTIATCDYIHPFSAGLQKDNFYATQFHPEKSADIGNIILGNFITI
ncbi:MAG: imidazole glycerol phosphate synthase subunit HisH [Sphingobacteriales bacterium]|nr:imidazole glycerol phosphate synthase subunit HisH [Sphingobacteriales bacterium]